MNGVIGALLRRQPQEECRTRGAYILSGSSAATRIEVLDASWFHDSSGRHKSIKSRENIAAVEKLVAGTAVYGSLVIDELGETRWPLPWDEYPLRPHEAVEMLLSNSQGPWVLRALRAEAGALALIYGHVKYQGRLREVLYGQAYRDLQLSVSVQGAARIRVRLDQDVSDRLVDDNSSSVVTFALKREPVKVRGLKKLWSSSYIGLTLSIKEALGDMVNRQPVITGKDYRG